MGNHLASGVGVRPRANRVQTPRWFPQYAGCALRVQGKSLQETILASTANCCSLRARLLMPKRRDAGTMDAQDYRNTFEVILRTGYLALSRQELDEAPYPYETKATLGGVVRFLANTPRGTCPKCHAEAAVMSGWGVYTAPWHCTSCGATFYAPSPVAKGVSPGIFAAYKTQRFIRELSGKPTIIQPPSALPSQDQPPDGHNEEARPFWRLPIRKGVPVERLALYDAFGKAHWDFAIEELRRFDREASNTVREGRPMNAEFKIMAGPGCCGEVLFGNVGGFAQIYRAGACKPIAAVPAKWDDHLGLWPTLRAAAEKLKEVAGQG